MQFIIALKVVLCLVVLIRSASSCNRAKPIGRTQCAVCAGCTPGGESASTSRIDCGDGFCSVSAKVGRGDKDSMSSLTKVHSVRHSCTTDISFVKKDRCLLSNYRPADDHFEEEEYLSPSEHEHEQFITCYCKYTIIEAANGCPKSASVKLKASTLTGIGIMTFISYLF